MLSLSYRKEISGPNFCWRGLQYENLNCLVVLQKRIFKTKPMLNRFYFVIIFGLGLNRIHSAQYVRSLRVAHLAISFLNKVLASLHSVERKQNLRSVGNGQICVNF